MKKSRGFAFRITARIFQVWLAINGIESYLIGPLSFFENGYKWEVDWETSRT